MDQSLDNKPDFKLNLISFFKRNKLKILLFSTIAIVLSAVIFIFDEKQKKENIIISEKYVKAGLLLNENRKDEAITYYEEIIQSKNKFYSLLALNLILEKDLINDKAKIIQYFSKLEKMDYSSELSDLIQFKKALYLIKIKEVEKSQKIFERLIAKDSNLKLAVQEIINKK